MNIYLDSKVFISFGWGLRRESITENNTIWYIYYKCLSFDE